MERERLSPNFDGLPEQFYSFMMVQKQRVFSRKHTSNSEV